MRSFNRSILLAVGLACVLFVQGAMAVGLPSSAANAATKAGGGFHSLVKCQNPAQCSIQRP